MIFFSCAFHSCTSLPSFSLLIICGIESHKPSTHTHAHTHIFTHTNIRVLVDNPVFLRIHSKFHASFLLFDASVLNEMDLILIIVHHFFLIQTVRQMYASNFRCAKMQRSAFLFTKKKNRVKFQYEYMFNAVKV